MDTQLDLNLKTNIEAVLSEAPQPIRDFFAQRKTEVVTKNLMQKYQLRVDQAAILEREIILLLLGLEDPKEFSDTLRQEAQLDERLVTNIMLDVNAQIFIPLRDQMKAEGAVQESKPVARPAQPVQKVPPPPPPAYSIPKPSPSPTAAVPPTRPVAAAPQPRPVMTPPAPRSDLAAAIQKATQTPPHPPRPQTPAPQAPVRPTPPPVMEAARTAPPASQQAAPPEPPKTRPYSVDPYREPVEGE